ncbi:transposase [Streptomyces sp. CB02009]|uniref:transposase n=1 Tax=Streptomyces sp. CB02009 TaxID=1703938 RepID=UPI00403ECD2C
MCPPAPLLDKDSAAKAAVVRRKRFSRHSVALPRSRQGATIKSVAGDLGVDAETLRDWIRAADERRPGAHSTPQAASQAGPEFVADAAETVPMDAMDHVPSESVHGGEAHPSPADSSAGSSLVVASRAASPSVQRARRSESG